MHLCLLIKIDRACSAILNTIDSVNTVCACVYCKASHPYNNSQLVIYANIVVYDVCE